MTLSSTTSRVSFAGNGVTTVFSFPYYFIKSADLKVILRDDVTFVETLQVITTDYTVTGAGLQAGGSVTFVTAPATGKTVTIYRDPVIQQDVDLVENDSLPAETVEKALDLEAMVAQRHQNLLTRSIRLSEGVPDADFDPILPTDLPGQADVALVTNPTGDGFIAGPTITDIANAQTNAAAAAASAAAALVSETNAAASEVAAASSVASVFGHTVVFKTFADSPVTITDADKGILFSFDATGGNIVVNLPLISGLTLTDPWVLLVKKTDATLNSVTLNRNGSDTFEAAATTLVLAAQNDAKFLVPTTVSAPDMWVQTDMTPTNSVATTARVNAKWDAVIGSGAQVSSGAATHSTWASAIAAVSAGDSILVLEGSWTENITLSKQLNFEGNGYGSYLNGSFTFASSSDRTTFKKIRVNDNITVNTGVTGLVVNDIYFPTGKTFVSSGNGNQLRGFKET